MPTYELTGPDGGTYHVDGPDVSSAVATLSAYHGAKAAAPAPDKYQQAALDERAGMLASGAPMQEGVTRRLIHGATLGADSTLVAGALTPLEMIKRGTFNPAEAYNYTKAREDLTMDKARENTGALGTAAEIAGGALSGGALAKAGISSAAVLPQAATRAGNFVRNVGVSSLDAGSLGAVSGAMEGNGLQERATNALKGGATGAVLGAALPLAIGGIKVAAAPLINNIKARLDPQGYADSQIVRGFHEGNVTPADASSRVIQAGNEGQDVYTVADAMGIPGQRLLSTAARGPGPGRTDIVEAMDSRQGDQGRRLASALREGFDAPQTAEQTRAAMSDQANREASFNYQPVKSDNTAIDVSNPVSIANRAISPAADRLAGTNGAVPTDLAARAPIEGQEAVIVDPIRSALKQARSYLAAPTLTSSNVHMAFRAKTNIDQMIATAAEKGQGAMVAELKPIRDSLDEALANTSSNYAAARDAYRIAQQRLEALDLGKLLGAKPVRSEDAIRQFGALSDPEAQQAFRVGYADPQISQVQGGAFGTNRARPFTSDATKDEFNAFAAPGKADLLQRQIGREQTMFESRHHAMGGSATTMNANDDAAMGAAPELVGAVGHVLTGNVGGVVRSILSAGSNWLKVGGNTPEVRQRVADILLQRAPNINPAALQAMVDQTVARLQKFTAVADSLRGAAGGAIATLRPGQKMR